MQFRLYKPSDIRAFGHVNSHQTSFKIVLYIFALFVWQALLCLLNIGRNVTFLYDLHLDNKYLCNYLASNMTFLMFKTLIYLVNQSICKYNIWKLDHIINLDWCCLIRYVDLLWIIHLIASPYRLGHGLITSFVFKQNILLNEPTQ